MALIDFIGRAVKEIVEKQQDAFEEFVDGIFKLEIDQINPESIESQVKDLICNSEQEVKNQEKGLSVLEKITNKNSIALDDFIKKLDQVTVEVQPIHSHGKKQISNSFQQKSSEKSNEQTSPNKKDQFTSLSQKYQKSAQYSKKIEADIQRNNFSAYKKSLQHYRQNDLNQNPERDQLVSEENQKTASEILAQLEEIHKQKSIERLKNGVSLSLNKRTRIMKMSNQMQEKFKEKKQKQAEERIKINVEFLESLKMKPSRQSPSFKEFKSFPKQDSEKLKQSIRIKTLKKTLLPKLDDYDHEPSTEERNSQFGSSLKTNLKNSNIFMESPLKLPQILEKKGVLKPKPYSVYNVTQRGNQMFVNVANLDFS